MGFVNVVGLSSGSIPQILLCFYVTITENYSHTGLVNAVDLVDPCVFKK